MKYVQQAKAERESRPRPPWADDPIAKSIEWTGTSEWGSDPNPNPKGAAVRIGSVNANRIEFQPGSARGLYKALIVISAVGLLLGYVATSSITFALGFPLFALSFGVVVWRLRRHIEEPLVFDKNLGMYWLGKSRPAPVSGAVASERLGRISDIYALQLISTRRYRGDPRMGAESDSTEIITYELNLVLQDGTRLSTVCLDDYDALDHDAKILAEFLQRPLWRPR